MVEKIILSKYRGFCAGVDYAVNVLEKLLKYHKPLYVKHKIVHNNYVVRGFEERGVIFVEDLKEIPSGNVVVLSAHGSPPWIKEQAEKLNLRVYDAACPLVTKVHKEALRFAKNGYEIIYICHRNHIEAKGTLSLAPMHVVERLKDVDELKINSNKIACIKQTTLSLDETKAIEDRLKQIYQNVVFPKKEDICYATQNRQNAIKEVADLSDLVLVIGTNISSNSLRLSETANRLTKTYLIESYHDVNEYWLKEVKVLGITTSASAPEFLLEELLEHLNKKYGQIDIVNRTREDEEIDFAPLRIKDE